MNDLIEALQIFAKYTNEECPTWCRHDELHVNVDVDDVSDEDKEKLEKLGFYVDYEFNDFRSYRFGSC